MDIEFWLSKDANPPEAEIISLRQEYAQDLFDDKKFIFSKYVVSSDGVVCLKVS